MIIALRATQENIQEQASWFDGHDPKADEVNYL